MQDTPEGNGDGEPFADMYENESNGFGTNNTDEAVEDAMDDTTGNDDSNPAEDVCFNDADALDAIQ